MNLAKRNLIKFNKGKSRVLHLGWSNPGYHCGLRADKVWISLAEEHLWILVKKQLTTS